MLRAFIRNAHEHWDSVSHSDKLLELRKYGFELVETGMPRIGSSANVTAKSRSRIHVFPDGTYIGGPSVKTDADKMDQIRQLSEHDADAFAHWVKFWVAPAEAMPRLGPKTDRRRSDVRVVR